jgi:hypothetical protein
LILLILLHVNDEEKSFPHADSGLRMVARGLSGWEMGFRGCLAREQWIGHLWDVVGFRCLDAECCKGGLLSMLGILSLLDLRLERLA